MASNKAIESIRKIQEAARLKVQEKLNRKGGSAPAIAPVTVEPKVDLAKVKRQIHAQIATSVAESFDSLKRAVVENKRINQQVISDILPQNCRFYQMGVNAGAFVIEYQPMRRMVFIGHEYNNQPNKTRNLPFPYFYFYISFRKDGGKFQIIGRGVGARISPLTSVDDELGHLPLCHTQGNTHVCLPMNRIHFSSLKEMADEFVEAFWQSRFVYNFEPFSVNKKRITSWEAWEKLDVMDMLKTTLQRGSSVKTLLNSAAGYDQDNSTGKLQSMVGRSEAAVQNAIKDAVNSLDLERFLSE